MDNLCSPRYPLTIRMDETLGDILARTNTPNVKTGISILDELNNGNGLDAGDVVEICGESGSGKSLTLMYTLANILIRSNPLPTSFGPPSSMTEFSMAGNVYTTAYRIILIDLEFRFQISLFTRILLATLQEYSSKSSLPNLPPLPSSSSSFPSSSGSPSSSPFPSLTSTNVSAILHYYLQRLEIYRPRTSRELALTLEYLSTQSKYVPMNETTVDSSSPSLPSKPFPSSSSFSSPSYRGSIAFIGIDGFGSSWLWQDRVGIPGLDKDIILANLTTSASSITSPTVTTNQSRSTSPSSVPTNTNTNTGNPSGTAYVHTSALGLNHEQDYQRIASALQYTILKHRCRILWTRSFIIGSTATNPVYQSSNIELPSLTQQYFRMQSIGQLLTSRTLPNIKHTGTVVYGSTGSTVSTDITVEDLTAAYRDYLPKCLSQLVKYTILMNKLNSVDTQYILSTVSKVNGNGLSSANMSTASFNLFNLQPLQSTLQQIGTPPKKKNTSKTEKIPQSSGIGNVHPQSLSIFIARLRSSITSKSTAPFSASMPVISTPRPFNNNAIPYVVKECNFLFSLFTSPDTVITAPDLDA